jgi:rhodanese-related sulfurtransferase
MQGFKNISSQEFEDGLKNNPEAVLLDVRTDAEFLEEHIPGAIQINVMSPDFPDRVMELDRSKAYYVYCRSGSRSGSACGYMASLGFTELFNLAPGIMGWNGEVVSNF